MSLVTRCSSCATVFRVVQDQLKVSEGWVRCGRCDQVFNALEELFDLQRDAPAGWLPEDIPANATESHHAPAGASAPLVATFAAAPTDPVLPAAEATDGHGPGTRRSVERSTPATRIDERDRLEFPDAQFDSDLAAESADGPAPSIDIESCAATMDSAASAEAVPQFLGAPVRRRRNALLRAAQYAAAGALALLLVLQAGHHFRDLIAARWPIARPGLVAWCDAVGCVIEAPRRIDDVSVESTALTRASIADAFNLSVAMRNRGDLPLAVPSIDLSLTDPTGQLVARRVLTPRDFRVGSTSVAPGAELLLQSVLMTGGAHITGYTVEVFYP